jgi:hypothetical protein
MVRGGRCALDYVLPFQSRGAVMHPHDRSVCWSLCKQRTVAWHFQCVSNHERCVRGPDSRNRSASLINNPRLPSTSRCTVTIRITPAVATRWRLPCQPAPRVPDLDWPQWRWRGGRSQPRNAPIRMIAGTNGNATRIGVSVAGSGVHNLSHQLAAFASVSFAGVTLRGVDQKDKRGTCGDQFRVVCNGARAGLSIRLASTQHALLGRRESAFLAVSRCRSFG